MIKDLADRLGAAVLSGIVSLRLRLGPGGGEMLARAAAVLARVLLGSRRRIAERNLRRVFGGSRGEAELGAILREAYFTGAASFLDLAPLYGMSREKYLEGVEVAGERHLRDALARGRGAIAISAHYGAFPMIGAILPARGIHLGMLYRKPKSPRTRALFDDWVARTGYEVIEDTPRHLAGLRCLELLGKGACVAILIDQHFPAGTEIPFFGHPARTGMGAALLAARSGAPFVPMRMLRTGPGRHRLEIEPAIEPPAGRSREELAGCMRALTGRVEAWIREEPSHWFWVHRRWKDLDRAEGESLRRY